MNLNLEAKTEVTKKADVKTYVSNIWGKIKNMKETELTNTINNVVTVIGKYWVCAQTVFFGVRPVKMYDTREQAENVIPKLYNLGVYGNFIIVKDIESGKFYIRAN